MLRSGPFLGGVAMWVGRGVILVGGRTGLLLEGELSLLRCTRVGRWRGAIERGRSR